MWRQIPVLIVAGIVAVFLADIFTPRGVAVWLFYLVPLVGTFWWRRRNVELGVAGACLLLIVMGYIGLPNETPARFAIVNRIMGGSVLVLTAVLIERLKRSDEQRRVNESALVERERHLRAILDSEPECVKTLAADGTLLQMNRAGLEMLEAERADQVLGHCIYPLVVPEHRLALQALTERVFQGQSGSLEFETVGLKGGRRWLETHATPLRDESGTIVSLLSVTRDITDRKRVESALRESESHFRLLFEQATEGVFVTDAQGRILDVNSASCQMTGYSRGELIGMSVADLVVPEEVPRIVPEINRLNVGDVVSSEWRYLRKDGSFFLGEVMAKQLPDGRLQAFARDITERKQAEQALHDSQTRLQLAIHATGLGPWDWDMVA
ncbi:MAG: PAS domain-containing protein [Planctomycetaceae bacterium]